MAPTLGTRIRELREAQDMSLREFAKKLGDISAAHISDIELGRRYPSDELLAKMGSLLRVPIGELRKYDTRPPVEDIKKRIQDDPNFGVALRKLVDRKISGNEIINMIEKKSERDKKK